MPKWSNELQWLRPIQNNLTPAIPFVVLFAVLVFVPSIRRVATFADPLAGVDPPPRRRPRPSTTSSNLTIRRLIGTAALVLIGVVVFTRADGPWLFLITQAAVLAIVYLSITVMTGLGGHISLCQGTYAAIGGFAVFQLADRFDLSVLPALFIGGAIAAVVGGLLSLPLLRLNGIWIAIATLAFAFFFDSVMVKFSWVGGSADTVELVARRSPPGARRVGLRERQVVPPPRADLPRRVHGRRHAAVLGTTGRTLRAVRGSDIAAQSIGISPARARIVVFTISAFIAAIGGGLVAIHQENVNYESNFGPFSALFWLVLVVTFGARRPGRRAVGSGCVLAVRQGAAPDGLGPYREAGSLDG